MYFQNFSFIFVLIEKISKTAFEKMEFYLMEEFLEDCLKLISKKGKKKKESKKR